MAKNDKILYLTVCDVISLIFALFSAACLITHACTFNGNPILHNASLVAFWGCMVGDFTLQIVKKVLDKKWYAKQQKERNEARQQAEFQEQFDNARKVELEECKTASKDSNTASVESQIFSNKRNTKVSVKVKPSVTKAEVAEQERE